MDKNWKTENSRFFISQSDANLNPNLSMNIPININSKSETTISPVKRSRNEMCNKQENGTFAPSMIPDMEFSRRKIAMDIY